jgi:hypothetical protein
MMYHVIKRSPYSNYDDIRSYSWISLWALTYTPFSGLIYQLIRYLKEEGV